MLLMRLLKDTRRRNVILLTVSILLVIIVMGVVRFFHQMHPKNFNAFTQLEAVDDIRSVPGGADRAPSHEYVKLQKQHNREQAKQAQKTGRSAISTIVDGFQADMPESQPASALDATEAQPNAQNALPTQDPSPFLGPQSDMQAIFANQRNSLSAQKAELMKQHMQGAMTQQMGSLFNNWNMAAAQESVIGIEAPTPKSNGFVETQHQDVAGSVIKAGTIFHALLLTSVNSDEPGPVLAKIVAGDLKGARVMGNLSNMGERVQIRFDKLNLPNVGQTISINAVAVDESTARTALSSYTDRHLMVRYGSLFASSLLEGYGYAFQRSGERMIYGANQEIPTSTAVLSRIYPELDVTGKLFVALGNVGSRFSTVLAGQFNQPATVHVHAGTGIGVLLTADLTGLPQAQE